MKALLPAFPDAPPALGPYSLAVQATGPLLFISGLTPWSPVSRKIERGTVAEQTRLILENLLRVLQAAGASLEDVVSCRVYLSPFTPETFAAMNAEYEKFLGNSRPARATVGVTLPTFDVEIEAVAALPHPLQPS